MLNKLNKIAFKIFMIIGIISSFVFVTYAWQSISQHALNEIVSEDRKLVKLVKYEKLLDGTITEIPIPNASFLLFKEDGTQVFEMFQTDKEGIIELKLPLGKYYFLEINPSYGFTFDKDLQNQDITKYSFEVTKDMEEPILVTAYNRKQESSLQVEKIVQNKDGSVLDEKQKEILFDFVVTFSDSGSYPCKINEQEPFLVHSGDTIQLKHKDIAVFEHLPIGITYQIQEKIRDNYEVDSMQHQGTITLEKNKTTFINTYNPPKFGKIRVDKFVQGDRIEYDKIFEFTIELDGKVTTFELKDREFIEFDKLPMGTKYRIEEKDYSADGYVSLINVYEGVINSEETVFAPYINSKKMTLEEVAGGIEVTKEVDRIIDPNMEFEFEIIFEGVNAPASPQKFKLKANETKIFDNIPKGVKYTIREIDSKGYHPVLEKVEGTIEGAEVIKVVMKNEAPKNTYPLKVQKVLTGNFPEEDKQKDFQFTAIINNKEYKFTLKPGEEKVFDVIEGSHYEVIEESYLKDGYQTIIDHGFGTMPNKEQIVKVENRYLNKDLEIEGEKFWQLQGYGNEVLPDSIIVYLKQGNFIIARQEVKADANGKWKYRFKVPRLDANQNEIQYQIGEEAIPHFTTTYQGYNITNTYVPFVDVNLPKVTKQIKQEQAPDTLFTFFLKAIDHAPMPKNSKDGFYKFTIQGKGSVDLALIQYEKEGEYWYEIYEENQHMDGWIYDNSVYRLKVIVTKNNHQLQANYQIIKDGKEVSSIVFENVYEKEILVPTIETITIEGEKTWIHNENPENLWPKSIIVKVYANDKLVAQKEVTEAQDWKFSFTLDKLDANGKEIIYRIEEEPILNYKGEINGYHIINRFEKEKLPPNDDSNQQDHEINEDTQDDDGNKDVILNDSIGGSNTFDKNRPLFWFILMISSLGMSLLLWSVNHRKTR